MFYKELKERVKVKLTITKNAKILIKLQIGEINKRLETDPDNQHLLRSKELLLQDARNLEVGINSMYRWLRTRKPVN